MELTEKQGAKTSAVTETAHTRGKYPGDILVTFRANKSQFTSLLEILFVILVVYTTFSGTALIWEMPCYLIDLT